MTYVPLALLSATLLVVVVKTATPVTNTDTFFHLRLGAEFLGGWPASAPGSVTTFATSDWLPTQWLGQIALALSESWFGLAGVAWLTGAFALTLTTGFFIAARRVASLSVAAPLVPLAVLACAPALSGRPQVMSYVFTLIVTTAWLRCSRTGRPPWIAIPVTWLWSMIHGMWVVGIVISAVAVIGLLMDRSLNRPGAWRVVAIPILSAASVALTPVGPGLYGAVLRVSGISHYFTEWAPPEFMSPSNAVAALLLVGALVLAVRGPWQTNWLHLLLLLLAGAWIVYSTRTVPIGVAMVTPLLAAQLGHLAPPGPRSRAEIPMVVGGVLVSLALMTLTVTQNASPMPHESSRAHASVADLPSGTAVLNDWNGGGYDMWRHPHLNFVMHGYGDMFTDEELARNYRISHLDHGWLEDLDSLSVDHALLPVSSQLAQSLEQESQWVTVVRDDSFVHLRRSSTQSTD